MKENNLKRYWIKCSLISLVIAFCISMIILEEENISLIQGNSYYLSSALIFLQTIFYPVPRCIIYSLKTEIVCQIIFWIYYLSIGKNADNIKKKTAYITIPIISNIIYFIIQLIIIFLNFNFVF